MVVATSTYQEVAVKRLKMAGIDEYFESVVSGDMVEHSKPNPDIFLLACEKLGVDRINAVVLEDSNSGIEAAHNAGIRSIMVPGLVPASESSELYSFMIVNSLCDVKMYLEENE